MLVLHPAPQACPPTPHLHMRLVWCVSRLQRRESASLAITRPVAGPGPAAAATKSGVRRAHTGVGRAAWVTRQRQPGSRNSKNLQASRLGWDPQHANACCSSAQQSLCLLWPSPPCSASSSWKVLEPGAAHMSSTRWCGCTQAERKAGWAVGCSSLKVGRPVAGGVHATLPQPAAASGQPLGAACMKAGKQH